MWLFMKMVMICRFVKFAINWVGWCVYWKTRRWKWTSPFKRKTNDVFIPLGLKVLLYTGLVELTKQSQSVFMFGVLNHGGKNLPLRTVQPHRPPWNSESVKIWACVSQENKTIQFSAYKHIVFNICCNNQNQLNCNFFWKVSDKVFSNTTLILEENISQKIKWF